MIPHNLKRNAFLDNLGSDWVAVNDAGEVVCRAESEAAVRNAYPHAAHFLNAAHLGNTDGLPIATAALSATDAALAAVKAQSQPAGEIDKESGLMAERKRATEIAAEIKPVAHTARPPAPKRVAAEQPAAKAVKVPARKAPAKK